MAYSVNDKVKKLFENEQALAVLEKYCPGISTDPSTPMAFGMAFKALKAFPQVGLDDAKLEAMEKELSAIE